MSEMEKKIKAVIFGHAVGDALGVPVEFSMRDELENDPVTGMRGYGFHPVPPGTWSDDTSMTLAELDVLAEGKIDNYAIMRNFAKWCAEEEYTATGVLFDIGGTCLTAIRRSLTSKHPSPEECGLTGEKQNGNGSLMRIHPYVLAVWYNTRFQPYFEKIIEYASAMTHAHGRSVLGCKIYALVLCRLLSSPKKESVLRGLRDARERYRTHEEIRHYMPLFSSDFPQLPIDAINSSGYVVDTLEAAIWCLLNTDSYRECVLKAVNLGEDTDTVAAVAGGLAGALYGYEAIPEEWLSVLARRYYINEMCERAARNWNGEKTGK